MGGRTGEAVDGIFQKVVYLPTYAENNFSPEFPSERVDIVYLCSPNNPTGTVLSRARLAEWIKWCKDNDAIFDVRLRLRSFHQHRRHCKIHL